MELEPRAECDAPAEYHTHPNTRMHDHGTPEYGGAATEEAEEARVSGGPDGRAAVRTDKKPESEAQ